MFPALLLFSIAHSGAMLFLTMGLGVLGFVTVTVGVTYKQGSESIAGTTNTYTSDSGVINDFTVNPSIVDQELDIPLTKNNIKALAMLSDQTVTIKTNSSTTPQETIVLTGKAPIMWTPDNGQVIPFAGNITKFYLTNAGSVVANCKFAFLLDQEPGV